jgi:LysM repeat protein
VAPVEPLVTVYYTVKPGDIASKIAVRNELNLASLQAMNPSRNLHLLTIGQQLRIR